MSGAFSASSRYISELEKTLKIRNQEIDEYEKTLLAWKRAFYLAKEKLERAEREIKRLERNLEYASQGQHRSDLPAKSWR